jgi:predicted ATPase
MKPSPAIDTRWSVITGAPSSGKSSLGLYLTLLGYRFCPETARLYTDLEMSKGRTVDDIRSDKLDFQRKVLKLHAEAEARISPSEIAFLDRSVFDGIAYGLPPDEVMAAYRFRYANIFFLEPVGFKKDYARVEDEAQASSLGIAVREVYSRFGLPIITVPKMSIEDRAQFILAKL